MSKRPAKLDLRFLVTTDRRDSTVRFTAHLVQVNEEGKVRNLRDDYRNDQGFGLADLVVSAQADTDRDRDGGWYATQVRYADVYSLQLDRAEAIVKTLRKVKKAFEAEGQDMNWGHGLEVTLAIASKALGVKGYLINRGSNGTGNWGHDGVAYEQATLDTVVRWGDEKLAEARG